jgi:hypothetical protein
MLEYQLQQRSTGIEESKERVERYKWVLTLLPSLTDKDESKKNFTVALVRLALTNSEAEQLFSGLQLSANQDVRQAAQEGFASIQNQELSRLVLQINATSSEERKHAVALLERDYGSSPLAVSMVLDMASSNRVAGLSPSGLINGLFFLSATDPQAWTKVNADRARETVTRLRPRNAGPQTAAAIQKLEALLKQLPY